MKGLLTLLVGLVAFTAAQADPQIYYYHLDQLGTPQALTDANQAVVWRADYEPFGQATVTLQNGINNPIRFPGQYYDAETGLNYNYFRDYNPSTGRYIQSDPIGLGGGINTYAYVEASPEIFTDSRGLYIGYWHRSFTERGATAAGMSPATARSLADGVVGVDHLPGSQDATSSDMHAMCQPGSWTAACEKKYADYVEEQLKKCTSAGLERAIHATQDSFSRGHRGFQPYFGSFILLPPSHLYYDAFPTDEEKRDVPNATADLIRRFQAICPCNK